MKSEDARGNESGCRLAGIGRLANLDAGTLEDLGRITSLRHYSSGQTVVREGEHVDFIGCVMTGFLRMVKTLADGREHIVGLLVEGDMFGRVFDGPPGFDIEAATDAEVCAFQREPFEKLLLHSPDLERELLLNILNELDRARDWMIILSGQKVSGRLAGFLLVLCSRFADVDHLLRQGKDGLRVKIPIDRADLAKLLGTRPESISRAFHALARAGLIEILRPDLVRILDLAGLAAEAGDDDLSDNPDLEALVESLHQRR